MNKQSMQKHCEYVIFSALEREGVDTNNLYIKMNDTEITVYLNNGFICGSIINSEYLDARKLPPKLIEKHLINIAELRKIINMYRFICSRKEHQVVQASDISTGFRHVILETDRIMLFPRFYFSDISCKNYTQKLLDVHSKCKNFGQASDLSIDTIKIIKLNGNIYLQGEEYERNKTITINTDIGEKVTNQSLINQIKAKIKLIGG